MILKSKYKERILSKKKIEMDTFSCALVWFRQYAVILSSILPQSLQWCGVICDAGLKTKSGSYKANY